MSGRDKSTIAATDNISSLVMLQVKQQLQNVLEIQLPAFLRDSLFDRKDWDASALRVGARSRQITGEPEEPAAGGAATDTTINLTRRLRTAVTEFAVVVVLKSVPPHLEDRTRIVRSRIVRILADFILNDGRTFIDNTQRNIRSLGGLQDDNRTDAEIHVALTGQVSSVFMQFGFSGIQLLAEDEDLAT